MKHIHMPKATADKWLAALRSGEYRQGQNALAVHDEQGNVGYCCLGVLQHCLTGTVETTESMNSQRPASYPSEGWLRAHGITFFEFEVDPYASTRPWLGALNTSADQANDTGASFLEIADAIEAEVEYTDVEIPA